MSLFYNNVDYWKKRGLVYRKEYFSQTKEKFEELDEQEEALKKVLREIDWSRIDTVLEIGCGFGRITRILLNHMHFNAKITCLDVSAEQLEQLKEIGDSRITTVCGDFTEVPYKEYDLVIASEVFLHIPPKNIEQFVLKAEGQARQYLIHIDPFKVNISLVNRLLTFHAWSHYYNGLYNFRRVEYYKLVPTRNMTQAVRVLKMKEMIE